jgi:hypothetical protein
MPTGIFAASASCTQSMVCGEGTTLHRGWAEDLHGQLWAASHGAFHGDHELVGPDKEMIPIAGTTSLASNGTRLGSLLSAAKIISS